MVRPQLNLDLTSKTLNLSIFRLFERPRFQNNAKNKNFNNSNLGQSIANTDKRIQHQPSLPRTIYKFTSHKISITHQIHT